MGERASYIVGQENMKRMIYICVDCDFEFREARRRLEPHGERLYGCPRCGSVDYRAAEICVCCGTAVAKTVDGVCRGCLSNLKNLIGFGTSPSGQINAFLGEIFPPSEIDEILERELRELLKNADTGKKYAARIKQYITEYEGELAGYAAEQAGR